jgi:hypothetical protein
MATEREKNPILTKYGYLFRCSVLTQGKLTAVTGCHQLTDYIGCSFAKKN